MKFALTTILLLIGAVSAVAQQAPKKTQTREIAVEVIPVLEFPLNLHEAVLVKSEKGYALKCRFSSNAEATLIGIRYSLTVIEPVTGARPLTTRIEGFEIAPYGSKTLTFPTPIRFRQKNDRRLLLDRKSTRPTP